MSKLLCSIVFVVIFASCGNGVWITSKSFRPKHPRFSITKESFLQNSNVDTKYWYVQSNGDTTTNGKPIFYYLGFYPDGRLLYDNSLNRQLDNTLNWTNSFIIGHHRPNGIEIKIEYFSPEGLHRGYYEKKTGIIKSDTIILIEKIPMLFKNELRYDTLVKSKYLLN